jgi:hypothetical protein
MTPPHVGTAVWERILGAAEDLLKATSDWYRHVSEVKHSLGDYADLIVDLDSCLSHVYGSLKAEDVTPEKARKRVDGVKAFVLEKVDGWAPRKLLSVVFGAANYEQVDKLWYMRYAEKPTLV